MLPTPHIEATIAGDVSGQLAVGSYIVQNNVDHGGVVFVAAPGEIPVPRPRPRPVRLPGRPAAVVGRARETAMIDQYLGPTCPVLLHGPSGVGKTALLKNVAHDLARRTPDDNVIYHSAMSEPLPDTLQFLFEAMYECDVPFKPADAQLRHALADTSGLVVLDDMVLDRDQFAAVVDTLPRATLLLASEHQCLTSLGRTFAIGALLPDDALTLLAQALGRPLDGPERDAGRRVTALLDHQPLGVLQFAALVVTLGDELARLESELEQAGSLHEEIVSRLVSSLDEGAHQILDTLGRVAGAAVTAEYLGRLAGLPDVTAKVDSLIRLHLAQAHSPRYSTRVGAFSVAGEDDFPVRLAAAATASTDPEAGAGLAGAALVAIAAAEARSDCGGVLALGRAVEPALIVGRRWGAWGVVLEAQLRAATAVGDRAAEAWARHQLGTRALCLGETAVAEEQLPRALDLRRELRDREGARATQHNLDLLRGAVVLLPDRHPKRWRPGLISVVLAVLVLVAAVAMALAMNGSPVSSAPGTVVAAGEALEFGTVQLGSGSGALVLELVNRGGRPSQPVRLVVDGPEKDDFAVTSTDCVTVAPGERCHVRLTFSPSAPGGRRATLHVAGDPNPLARLAGEGAARTALPLPRLEPTTLDFGELPLGSPGKADGVSIVNAGAGELGLRDVSVAGDASSDFTLTLDCPTMRIAPGGTCAIGVVFAPSAARPRTARLEVSFSGSGALAVDLVGVGIEVTVPSRPIPESTEVAVPGVRSDPLVLTNEADVPVEPPTREPAPVPTPVVGAEADPTLLDFGNEAVGERSDPRTVTVTNTGTADLAIAEPVLSGSGAELFVLVTDGCGGIRLRPGERCVLDLAFAPVSVGPVTAVLELRGPDLGRLAVELEGLGRQGMGALALLPPSVTFPSTDVGATSTSTVLAVNTGRSSTTITSVAVSGDEEFVLEGGTCVADVPVQLEPGAICELLLVFVPSEPGVRTGSLVVTASGTEMMVVPLEGRSVGRSDLRTVPACSACDPLDRTGQAFNVGGPVGAHGDGVPPG